MTDLYLFVGEYEDSYTGGSVVFISTEEFLKEFSLNGLNVILDEFNNQLYKVRKFPGSYDGSSSERFWELVEQENFSEEFKKFLRKNKQGYPDGRIRPDWFPKPEPGIYIVYKLRVEDDNEDVVIISDTYYCS